MKISDKIKAFLVIAAVFGAVAFLGKVYMSAKSPSSAKVTVYKVELMTGASDPNPQVIFSDAAGRELDLVNETGAIFGQALMQAGTFNRIRMTVSNGFKLSITSAADNPCGGAVFTDNVFPVAGYGADREQAQINFASQEDGGGSWKGQKITHLLIAPLTVTKGGSAGVRFRFSAADTLFCSGGTVQMLAPWSLWAEVN